MVQITSTEYQLLIEALDEAIFFENAPNKRLNIVALREKLSKVVDKAIDNAGEEKRNFELRVGVNVW